MAQLTGYYAGGDAIPQHVTASPPPRHRPLLAPLALVLVAVGGVTAPGPRQGGQTTAGLAALCFVPGALAYAAVPGLNRTSPWLLPRRHESPELARVVVHADERSECGLVIAAPTAAGTSTHR